jgi:RHS repeat-associated protein
MNGIGYTYGAKPHAVTAVGSTNYTYDANGNMNVGTASIWDVENRPTSVTKNSVTSISVYDGDGNRVKQTVGTQITLYINQYYEINTTTGVSTSYYYLGGQLVAQRVGSGSSYTTTYIHQDSLGSTSVVSNYLGASIGSMKYTPFGLGRITPDTLGTTKEFTGQRLDSTGIYYYNARYYDPNIGRFVSPDNVIQNPADPQTLNRYSYCVNNPLKYTDPSGHRWNWQLTIGVIMIVAAVAMCVVIPVVAPVVTESIFAALTAVEFEPVVAGVIVQATLFGVPALVGVTGFLVATDTTWDSETGTWTRGGSTQNTPSFPLDTSNHAGSNTQPPTTNSQNTTTNSNVGNAPITNPPSADPPPPLLHSWEIPKCPDE